MSLQTGQLELMIRTSTSHPAAVFNMSQGSEETQRL